MNLRNEVTHRLYPGKISRGDWEISLRRRGQTIASPTRSPPIPTQGAGALFATRVGDFRRVRQLGADDGRLL